MEFRRSVEQGRTADGVPAKSAEMILDGSGTAILTSELAMRFSRGVLFMAAKSM